MLSDSRFFLPQLSRPTIIILSRCILVQLKCITFYFCWASAPGLAGTGDLTQFPDFNGARKEKGDMGTKRKVNERGRRK